MPVDLFFLFLYCPSPLLTCSINLLHTHISKIKYIDRFKNTSRFVSLFFLLSFSCAFWLWVKWSSIYVVYIYIYTLHGQIICFPSCAFSAFIYYYSSIFFFSRHLFSLLCICRCNIARASKTADAGIPFVVCYHILFIPFFSPLRSFLSQPNRFQYKLYTKEHRERER
jgi:hypothetical protein